MELLKKAVAKENKNVDKTTFMNQAEQYCLAIINAGKGEKVPYKMMRAVGSRLNKELGFIFDNETKMIIDYSNAKALKITLPEFEQTEEASAEDSAIIMDNIITPLLERKPEICDGECPMPDFEHLMKSFHLATLAYPIVQAELEKRGKTIANVSPEELKQILDEIFDK